MENENTNIKPVEQQSKISTPMAIVLAGVLIMVGIIASKGGSTTPAPKTLSEQVGVSKENLLACIKGTDLDALNKSINDSVDKAMVNVSQRGTPYSVVIGKDGVKTEIKGADSYANVKQMVNDALIGKVATVYTGNIPPVTSDEHIFGNPDAIVTIVEYSDFECPYCKQFQPVLKQIVQESGGNVRWVYRDYPLHQHSFEKLVAAECIAKLKGNDAYWKYGDLLFSLLKTADDSVSEQL
jgi:protein-disulfide isomerase